MKLRNIPISADAEGEGAVFKMVGLQGTSPRLQRHSRKQGKANFMQEILNPA